ncbi:MAG: hypothetical protein ACPKPY_05885 [Nitrososphaeraceae archaeon]
MVLVSKFISTRQEGASKFGTTHTIYRWASCPATINANKYYIKHFKT